MTDAELQYGVAESIGKKIAASSRVVDLVRRVESDYQVFPTQAETKSGSQSHVAHERVESEATIVGTRITRSKPNVSRVCEEGEDPVGFK